MQTSKISVVLCALMACAPLSLRATDTPAQAAARAQVVEKLKELEAQDAATNPQAPAAVVVAPAVDKPAPAPVVVAPVAPAPNEPALKPIHQTKAEKAAAKLKAKQDADKAKADKQAAELQAQHNSDKAAADLKAQKQATKLAAVQAEADQAAAKKQAAEKAKADKAAAKAKAKADKQAAELKARQNAAVAKASQTTPAAPKPAVVPIADAGKDIGLKPVTAPALPIAADKASRLQALLAKYQADQISPEVYHKQRAAILAEP